MKRLIAYQFEDAVKVIGDFLVLFPISTAFGAAIFLQETAVLTMTHTPFRLLIVTFAGAAMAQIFWI
jgi:hypothetical protein